MSMSKIEELTLEEQEAFNYFKNSNKDNRINF